MGLVEDGQDLVSFRELRDFATNSFDRAGAIRGGYDVVAGAEGVLAFGDDEIPVIQRGGMDCTDISTASAYFSKSTHTSRAHLCRQVEALKPSRQT